MVKYVCPLLGPTYSRVFFSGDETPADCMRHYRTVVCSRRFFVLLQPYKVIPEIRWIRQWKHMGLGADLSTLFKHRILDEALCNIIDEIPSRISIVVAGDLVPN